MRETGITVISANYAVTLCMLAKQDSCYTPCADVLSFSTEALPGVDENQVLVYSCPYV